LVPAVVEDGKRAKFPPFSFIESVHQPYVARLGFDLIFHENVELRNA
jgi:hypothetical protein